ncbi:SusD/RagB family nutrient-binding outer membrane lipoprotein [uncultured Formosa sp.]|uniref:SusD/RagB family nutrient-binding outer membrane lipoprotein n=1 Tax=uncultured Formosa sp. TaxID=255435 RepID=UPI00262364F7|nr:SusD/RagB family nutrient-binding outer membrane lipoprotein [uncultured Formosa sp.]
MKNTIIKTKYLFLLSLIIFSLNGCTDDITDINEDPLAVTTVPPYLLFPEVIVNMSSQRVIEFAGSNMHAQQWAGSAGTWRSRSRYTLGVPSVNNAWTNWYTTCLKNLSLVELLVEKDYPEDVYITAQAKILEGFIYSNITQVWGEVPFTQAGNPTEYPNPEFDSQETVMEGIVTLMDEAIAILEQDIDSDIVDDLIFDGDKEAWIRWANSIKLKMLMFMANIKPTEVSDRLQEVANSALILTNEQEAKLKYSSEIGNENPKYTFINNYWGGNVNLWYAGSPLVNLMNDLDDPRRATYFDQNVNGVYVGLVQGYTGVTLTSKINVNNILADTPDRYSTASETYFLLADAAANGYISGGLAQANTWFLEGVTLALDYFDGSLGEISQTDKDTYIASLPDLSTLTTDEALDYINDQHYISLFGNGIEAWNLWKRTKSVDFDIPNLSGASDIIRRYTYSSNEAAANINIPTEVTIEDPMWFEK